MVGDGLHKLTGEQLDLFSSPAHAVSEAMDRINKSVFENLLNPRHDICLDYMPLSQVAGPLSLAMVDGLTRSFSRASHYDVSQ